MEKAAINPFVPQLSEMDVVSKKVSVSRPKLSTSEAPCAITRFCTNLCKSGTGRQQYEPKTHRVEKEVTLNGCKVNKILERLQVESFPVPPSKLEYKPTYFTGIKDRPLKEGFKRHDFSKTQRTGFFNTLMTGFIRDDVSKRKEQHKLDMRALSSISDELDLTKKTFKKFIELCNEDSVALVKHQLHAGHQREEVDAKLASYKGILSTIKAQIFRAESQLSTLLLCRDLILKLSPSAWRMEYEYDAKQYEVKRKWLADLCFLYDDYCRYYPEPGKDFFLDEAMELLFKEIQHIGPPHIYFTESWQIAMVLRRKELDCINQLGDIIDLERKITEIEHLSRDLVKYRTFTMKNTVEQMEQGRAEYNYQKKRVTELEATANAMIPMYVEKLFSGDLVLETIALIEWLYADFFGLSRQQPDPIQMMIQIEAAIRLQEEILVEIEPKVLQHYMKKVEDEAKKKERAAAKATRVLREVHGFVNSARNMYVPPPARSRTWKIPVRRSKLKIPKNRKNKTLSKRDENFQHLQVSGIFVNDEIEGSLDKVISAYFGVVMPLSPRESEEFAELSNIMSCASTMSLENLAYDLHEQSSSSRSSKEELHKLQEMGYDSDEELIKQNYEKKKHKVEKPAVMYDAQVVDDRFMVGSAEVNLTEKSRRHVGRDHFKPPKNNPLSWR